jgi:RNA polymerase sigma-70 factor, ECF subfamily
VFLQEKHFCLAQMRSKKMNLECTPDIERPMGAPGRSEQSPTNEGSQPAVAREASIDAPQPSGPLETFRQHRAMLFSIAYRMLGTTADAEDVLQETYIRWQGSRETELRSARAFLVTIVSRLCINHLQSARVRREQYFGQWLPEPLFTGAGSSYPMPRTDGSLSVAFMMLLERLTPIERAVFLLREVFEYEYDEIAEILQQRPANCRQIFHRARKHVKQGRARFDATRQQHEELLQRFLQASSAGDMDGLFALFSKEIVLYADGGGRATAVPNAIYGAENVLRFLVGARKKLLPTGVVRRVIEINGRPGAVLYLQERPFGALSLNVQDGRITDIYIVSNPEKLTGLPTLPDQQRENHAAG